jgi:hypothetical protein
MHNTLRGHIAMRPAALQYVRWREYLRPDQQMQIPGRSPVSMFLQTQFSFCVLFHSEGFFPPPPAPQLKGFTDRLTFELHGPLATEQVFQLIDFTAARLDEFVTSMLYDDLIREIICGKMSGQHEKTIVENYLRETGLEDDISWDAAIKKLYRDRKERNLPSFRGHTHLKRMALAV